MRVTRSTEVLNNLRGFLDEWPVIKAVPITYHADEHFYTHIHAITGLELGYMFADLRLPAINGISSIPRHIAHMHVDGTRGRWVFLPANGPDLNTISGTMSVEYPNWLP